MVITQDKNFKKLFETDIYLVGHIFETTYFIDKVKASPLILGEFYGDPSCAIVDKDNKWCLVGGSTLVLWTPYRTIEIKDTDLYGVCELKQTANNKAQILIDPWADNSSIWELDTITAQIRKLSEFNNYKDKEFTEIIQW